MAKVAMKFITWCAPILSLGFAGSVAGQTNCTPAPPGLVSWWPGDGSAADSAGQNNGTQVGNVTFTPGEVGQAFSLSGNGDYITIPDSPSLSFTNDFSIELWYKDGGLSGYCGLIAKRTTGVNDPCNFGVTIVAPSTLLVYLLDSSNPSFQSVSYGGLPGPGAFHHIAVTFHQQANQIQIKEYLDGQLVTTGTVPGNLSRTVNNAAVTIGASNSTGEFFKGNIDEVSIYGRLLTDSEIAAIYGAGTSGKCSDTPPVILTQPASRNALVGQSVSFSVAARGLPPLTYQWSKDGNPLPLATNNTLSLTGLQTNDSGNYAVTITNTLGSVVSSNAVLMVNVAPPCDPPPSELVSWWQGEGDASDALGPNNGVLNNGALFASGEVGQGFLFNGTGGYVQIPDSPSLSFTNDFSIELWYKDNGLSAGAYGGLIAKRPTYGPCNYGITVIGGAPSALLVYLEDPKYGSYQSMRYNGLPAAGAFHHLAVTFHQQPADYIELKAYVDGQSLATNSVRGSLTRVTNNTPVSIGSSNPSGEFFKGVIDEVSIYGKVLSDNEIASIYASGVGGKCVNPLPPSIYAQPANETGTLGQTATFGVGAAGSHPLAYQWFYNGTAVVGATNSSLLLTNLEMSQSGTYSVLVTNAYGSILSSNASLGVVFPAATVKVFNTLGTAGQVVTVPILLVANGNENAIGFSLNYSPTLLTNVGVALGTGVTNGTLQFNTNQAGAVGVAVALSSGATFAPGSQEVAEISFVASPSASGYSVPLTFGDQPTKRELSDANAGLLAANFSNGQLTLSRSAFEADVSPRPNGDGAVTIVDWVQVGRYVAALDSPTNASEFQRADCAPRATSGDGLLTVSDWVQAGRYVAGLDPLTVAAGPTGPPGPGIALPLRKEGGSTQRVVSVQAPPILPGQTTGTALVELVAQGDENAIGLSLAFDPKVVSYTSASLGSDATSASMDVNANQATNGEVGIIMALPTGASFSPGTRQVLKVTFQALTTNTANSTVALGDLPVRREVADTNAVVANYVNGTIAINPRPSISITHASQAINLSWP